VGRRHGAGDRRPAYRRGPSGADFRRRHERLQLHPGLRRRRLYAEASWTQALADWIGADTRAYAAIGGVPKLLVPDNTKSLPQRKRGSLSSKPAFTSRRSIGPSLRWGRLYAEMAAHYDYRDPASPAAPAARQGKEPAPTEAGVEVAVLIIERWLLGRLRHRRFYGLAFNTAIS
jgi:hypothetical protein